MPRVYIHIQAGNNDHVIAVPNVRDTDTCESLAKAFVESPGFRRRFKAIRPAAIRFRVCGKPEGGLLPQVASVGNALRSDLTPATPGYADAVAVIVKLPESAGEPESQVAEAARVAVKHEGAGKRERPAARHVGASSGAGSDDILADTKSVGGSEAEDEPAAADWRSACLQAELGLRGGVYRQAIQAIKQAVEAYPGGAAGAPTEARVALLRCRAWVQMKVGRPARAVKLLRQAVSLSKKDPSLACEFGESLLQTGDSKAAVSAFDGAAVELRKMETRLAASPSAAAAAQGKSTALIGAHAAYKLAMGKGGRFTLCNGPGGLCTTPFPGVYCSTDALLGCARALWKGGNLAGGVQVINAIVETGAGDEHAGVLVEYSRACEALGQHSDSLQQILRAILLRQDDVVVKRRLAQVLSRPGMSAAAIAMLGGDTEEARSKPGAEGKMQAVGYLAGAVKEFGACETAIALRQSGVRLGPQVANVALNLAHDLECVGDLQGAIRCIAAFARYNATTTIQSTGAESFDAAAKKASGSGSNGGKEGAAASGADPSAAGGVSMVRTAQLGEVLPVLEAAAKDLHCWARAGGYPCPAARPVHSIGGEESSKAGSEELPGLLEMELAKWIVGSPKEERPTGAVKAGGRGRGSVSPLEVVQGKESSEGLSRLPRTAYFSPSDSVEVKPAAMEDPVEGIRDGVRAAWRNRLSVPSQEEQDAAHERSLELQDEAYIIDTRGERQVVVWHPGPWPHAAVVPEKDAPAERAKAEAARKASDGVEDPMDRKEGESAQEHAQRVAACSREIPDSAQLDALALLMTAIKIIHIAGALPLLPPLIATIERVRQGCALHQTSIRNEAAYYACVVQVVAHMQAAQLVDEEGEYKESGEVAEEGESAVPLPCLASTDGAKPIYVLGDSHCVSPAWGRVSVPLPGSAAPTDRLLRPALVTGCKVWHLRRESCFYPRINYEAVAGAIPRGSDIIWMPGEIDCREGVSRAVSQMRYKDGDAAIRSIVRVAIERIGVLARRLGARVFVHPVPPVVDVTRPIVAAYNLALRDEIKGLQAKLQAESGSGGADSKGKVKGGSGKGGAASVHWLDIFDSLVQETDKPGVAQGPSVAEAAVGALSGAGTTLQLDPRWEMDGTHLHPAYVSLLGEAMAQCENES